MSDSRREDSYELPAVADSIAVARTIVHDLGEGVDEAAREDAALLVSELMSNAVRHGGHKAVLTVAVQDGVLRIAVHDDGDGVPQMRAERPDPTVTSGRGLQIVDRVAQEWGIEADADGAGKTVWFELAADDSAASKVEREDRRVWS